MARHAPGMGMWNSRKDTYFTDKIKELASYKSDYKPMMQIKGKRRHSLDPPEPDTKAGKSMVLNFSLSPVKMDITTHLTEDQI